MDVRGREARAGGLAQLRILPAPDVTAFPLVAAVVLAPGLGGLPGPGTCRGSRDDDARATCARLHAPVRRRFRSAPARFRPRGRLRILPPARRAESFPLLRAGPPGPPHRASGLRRVLCFLAGPPAAAAPRSRDTP